MSIKIVNLFDGIPADFADFEEGLQAYLNEVWQSRPLFFTDYQDEKEAKSKKQRFFRFRTEKIQPRNYVGFVQYQGLRINVYPRIFYNHRLNVIQEPSIAINHVLKWLSYSNRIHFPFNQIDHSLQDQDDWLEALVFLFSNYALDVLSSSPHFAYQEVTEEMTFIRGRLAMQDYVHQNLVTGRHNYVHCTYEPFIYDNLFNRVVKHTCRVLQSVTLNKVNRRLLDELLFVLDGVADVFCTADDCAKVPENRLHPGVSIISNMCQAFLTNQAYTEGMPDNQNLCVLLPMEVIYEHYVAGFIKRHFPSLEAISQASGEYVALTGPDFTENAFRMKHDILLPGQLIIDTKYKFRKDDDKLKGGISQGDIYQMVTYCYKRQTANGLLLYPKYFASNANNKEQHFKIRAGNNAEMIITAKSLDITEEAMGNFDENQVKKISELLQPLL